LDEQAQLEERDFGGQAGAYILGKVALEAELKDCCVKRNIAYTSIRPAFIYGPNNYAQRESMFFYWILQAGQIIYPKDADGSFQMVYVDDVAKILLAVCGNEQAYNQAYNVCGEGQLTYERFADVLQTALDTPFTRAEITVREVNERNIPLPFPLTKAESEHYDGSKILELGVSYTPIARGMRETYAWFLQNFEKPKTYS
jgi:nucleoside-diphosphate-sugar epimerase